MEIRSDLKINKYFFLAIIIAMGAFLLYSLIEFFTAFLAAVMIYVLTKPLTEYLVKKCRWSKRLAAIVIIVFSCLIIMGPLTLFVSMIYNKMASYIQDPEIILRTLRHFDEELTTRYGIRLLSDDNIQQIQAFSTGLMSTVLNNSLNFFSTFTMMYFFLYFMIINVNRMEAAIVFFLPFPRNQIELFGRELVAQTVSNAFAVPLIGLVQGGLAYFAYRFAGLPEPGFWAVFTGMSSIVPVVGTALVWAPAAVYLIATGHMWPGISLIAFGAVVLSSADNVVRFLLAKKMADTHPIVTVLGVVMGLKFFNLPGLIFGPLLISYFLILLKIYYWEFQTPVPVLKRKKNRPVRFNLPFLGKEQ